MKERTSKNSKNVPTNKLTFLEIRGKLLHMSYYVPFSDFCVFERRVQ